VLTSVDGKTLVRRYRLPEKDVISPDELLSALKRYLEESGDTERAVPPRSA
jgi:hypothetical protein